MIYAADGQLEPPWVNDEDCLCVGECEEYCEDEECDCPYHGGDEYEFDKEN